MITSVFIIMLWDVYSSQSSMQFTVQMTVASLCCVS